MAELDDQIDRIVDTLKQPVRIDPALTARVMAEIERLPALEADTRSSWGWLRRRWTIRLSPLGGLAGAAGLTALVLAVGRLTAPGGPSNLPRGTSESPQGTQFVLVAPKAATVSVVGDFNDWNLSATPLVRAGGDGVWWVTLPLAPGHYRYSFVVDGATWLSDPEAPRSEDEFGRPNSVVTIGGS